MTNRNEATEQLCIGKLIASKLEENGRSVLWLASKISCKSANVYKILEKDSVNTAQLLQISLALKFDFFSYFSDYYETMK
jgi:hypothetical protein